MYIKGDLIIVGEIPEDIDKEPSWISEMNQFCGKTFKFLGRDKDGFIQLGNGFVYRDEWVRPSVEAFDFGII